VGQKILKSPDRKKLVKSNKSKNIFREIAFLAVLNFFPAQSLIFGHFLKLQKIESGQKIFREITIFYFTSFFLAWTFKFSGP